MAGVLNDYLIYPILELIRREQRKMEVRPLAEDPFSGTPAVTLYRDHPLDPERVTGVKLLYPSDYSLQVYLTLGTEDRTQIPAGITETHPEWEYYTVWRLSAVGTQAVDPDGRPLANVFIRLLYDQQGLLTGTAVDRIENENIAESR